MLAQHDNHAKLLDGGLMLLSLVKVFYHSPYAAFMIYLVYYYYYSHIFPDFRAQHYAALLAGRFYDVVAIPLFCCPSTVVLAFVFKFLGIDLILLLYISCYIDLGLPFS